MVSSLTHSQTTCNSACCIIAVRYGSAMLGPFSLSLSLVSPSPLRHPTNKKSSDKISWFPAGFNQGLSFPHAGYLPEMRKAEDDVTMDFGGRSVCSSTDSLIPDDQPQTHKGAKQRGGAAYHTPQRVLLFSFFFSFLLLRALDHSCVVDQKEPRMVLYVRTQHAMHTACLAHGLHHLDDEHWASSHT